MITKKSKPIIGLNMSNNIEDRANPSMKIYDDYIDAVTAAVGIPMLLPQLENEQDIVPMLSVCDGFVLIGGYDYDPLMWGENERHPSVQLCEPRRLKFDLILIKQLLETRLPILGICGGHQLINIGTGGTLCQDIFSDRDFSSILNHRGPKNETIHEVTTVPGSRIERITGVRTLAVNSTHHMAVKTIGEGLLVTARSSDGCIEAIESTDPARFILGVQWHPEALIRIKQHLDIFRTFVAQSTAR